VGGLTVSRAMSCGGPRRLGGLWLAVVLACGIAAALGFVFTDVSSAVQGDRAAALAPGVCWRC
jgi:hypothetical protein